MVIRRMVAAAGMAGLALLVSGLAASPAWAAQGERGAQAGLVPLSGEWWFTTWKILPKVWPLTQGAGVTVAVLDSGVQAGLPDLRGAVLPGGDVTGHRTGGETDFSGHGTMMSVLIAGQGGGTGMVGIAPAAKILPVAVSAAASDAAADPGAIAAGITYAAAHGARVIDITLAHQADSASGCDAAEQKAVAYALSRDIVVVAPAGNTGLTGAGPTEPASCAGVLAVGAIQRTRAMWPGSVRQPYVTIADQGAGLITSGRDGQLVTGVNDTGAASALAAGAVALIRSRYPALPWYRVIQRLTGTALPEGGNVPNDSYGYGILRLSHAVNAAAYPVPASAPDPAYAKYRAWLNTPQGRSVSRQIAGSRQAAPRPPASGGSSAPAVIAVLALLAAAGAVVVLAARKRFPELGMPRLGRRNLGRRNLHRRNLDRRNQHRRNLDRNRARHRQPAETAFPDFAGQPEEPGGYRGLLADDQLIDLLPPPETGPYRVPPYSPSPAPGSWPYR